MEVKTVKLSELVPDPSNPRTHPERNLDAIRASIARFGQVEPIVVQRGTHRIIGGHGRLAALNALGATEAAVVEVEIDDAGASALGLALNRTAELAGWDSETLGRSLAALQKDGWDCAEIGWFGDDLASLKSFGEAGGESGVIGNTEPNAVPHLLGEAVTCPGDLWILGEHRLLCGDSTKPEDVARVMGKERAALMNTDPPYGINYSKTKDGIPRSGFSNHQEIWGNIKSDDLEGKELQAFLESVFRTAKDLALLQNAAWYLWHAHLTQGFFAAADVILHRQIIWKKPGFVITRSGMYHWSHEPAFYGWSRGNSPPWYGDKSQTSVWDLSRDSNHGKMHPTQKPVELFAIPIRNHTRPGEVCYEPFAGSGSQIVAAEQLRRRCFAIEIEPRYVDVIVKRWQSFSGKKATRESDGKAFDDLVPATVLTPPPPAATTGTG